MNRAFRWLFGAAASILACQLLLPPVIGLANNSDFNHVLQYLKLAELDNPPDGRYMNYVAQTWIAVPDSNLRTGVFTSEVLLLQPAYWLNRALFSKDGMFDIRWTGITHGALFLLALWLARPLFAKLPKARATLLGVLVLWFFTDVEYAMWLNTMYPDPAGFVLLLLVVVLFLRIALSIGNRRTQPGWFALCALLLVTSKIQHALPCLLIAAVMLWRRDLFAYRGRRWTSWAAALSIAVAAIAMTVGSPRWYGHAALYNIMFQEVVPKSPDPAATLRELGLDSSYLAMNWTRGLDAGSPFRNPGIQRDFIARTGPFKLARHYLMHPGTALRLWYGQMGAAGERRETTLGNFVRNTGHAALEQSRAFALASNLKRRLMLDRPWAALLYFALPFGFLIALLWRRRSSTLLAGALALAGMAVIEMLLSTLLDCVETTRHLFLYNAMVDLGFVSAVAAALAPSTARDAERSRPALTILEPSPAAVTAEADSPGRHHA